MTLELIFWKITFQFFLTFKCFFVVFCGLAKIEKGERQQTTSLTNNREEKYSMKKKKKDDESKSDNDVDSGDPKTGKQFDDYVKKKD